MDSKETSIAFISIDEEIKVVGLSFQKSGLPPSYENLGVLWDRYIEKHRYGVKNAVVPAVEIGVCVCDCSPHEYIAGCAVTEICEAEEGWASFVIQPGRYVKVSYAAAEDTYSKDMPAWAEENGIEVDFVFQYDIKTPDGNTGQYNEIYNLFRCSEEGGQWGEIRNSD